MSDYEKMREFFKTIDPEDKINIFRQEVRPILSAIKGYSNLITTMVKERGVPNMPDDFLVWCETIVDKSTLLQDLIEAAFYPDHRSVYQEQSAARDREFGESLWKHQQAGLPELGPFQSLRDAIITTAQNMGLSLEEPSLNVDDRFWYPGGGATFLTKGRYARVQPQSQPYSSGYQGYALNLHWTTDQRNLKGQNYETLAPDLGKLAFVLHRWLVEKSELSDLIHELEWLQHGKYRDD